MEKNEAELGPKPNKENQQDKIAGPKKIDREPGVKGSDPSKTVNVLDLPTVQCKCDNITWHEVKVLKTLTIKEADQSTMKPKEIKHVIVDELLAQDVAASLVMVSRLSDLERKVNNGRRTNSNE